MRNPKATHKAYESMKLSSCYIGCVAPASWSLSSTTGLPLMVLWLRGNKKQTKEQTTNKWTKPHSLPKRNVYVKPREFRDFALLSFVLRLRVRHCILSSVIYLTSFWIQNKRTKNWKMLIEWATLPYPLIKQQQQKNKNDLKKYSRSRVGSCYFYFLHEESGSVNLF